jgi:hypothetical protein
MRGMVDSCLILLWRNQIINTYVAIPDSGPSPAWKGQSLLSIVDFPAALRASSG